MNIRMKGVSLRIVIVWGTMLKKFSSSEFIHKITRIVIIVIICIVVLNFPDNTAGITILFVAARERKPVIINSLEIIAITIHDGM